MKLNLGAALMVVWLAVVAPLHAVEFSSVTNAGKRATICRVHLKSDRLRLYLRDDAGQPLKSFAALDRLVGRRGEKVVFAMNAGMFRPDFSPAGLFVAQGGEVVPVNLSEGDGNFFLKPNGVFVLSRSGARVVESSKYSALAEPALEATQSGPMLVQGGVIHPKFNLNSQSRHIRNGVGVRSTNEVVFAITEEPVTFHEFATLFRDILGCPDALYLDGFVSGLYAPDLNRNDRRTDLGPIIAVVR